jgi:hypothetical protein
MSIIELKEEVLCHFHIFWDNFPFPVMLVHKDRTILDRNSAAEAMGCVVGTRCIDRGTKAMHKNCQANVALREKTGKRVVAFVEQMGMVMDSYWVPLAGYEDVFIHFGIDITPYADMESLPEVCGEKPKCSCSNACR